MFTKQHYIQFARVVWQCRQDGADDAADLLQRECRDIFRADNPKFSDERWEAACNDGLIQAREGTKPRKAFKKACMARRVNWFEIVDSVDGRILAVYGAALGGEAAAMARELSSRGPVALHLVALAKRPRVGQPAHKSFLPMAYDS